jgi:hypothetical protein
VVCTAVRMGKQTDHQNMRWLHYIPAHQHHQHSPSVCHTSNPAGCTDCRRRAAHRHDTAQSSSPRRSIGAVNVTITSPAGHNTATSCAWRPPSVALGCRDG